MQTAVITMVYNEAAFLPLWLDHYGTCFGLENLFVIDDGSTDGSTSDPRIRNLVAKRRSPLDEDDRASLISMFHEQLLGFYDGVIYTDVDEFIVVDPDVGIGLADYIGASLFCCRAPIGFEIVHRFGREQRIDFDRSLFEQRRFVRFDIDYSKPVIARSPVRWNAGFHSCDLKYQTDCNIILFHLRSIDYELSRARIGSLNGVRFSQNSIRKEHGCQFRLQQAQYLALLYGAGDVEFDQAAQREPDAMLRAYLDHNDRRLSRLDPHWSGRIDLRLGARRAGVAGCRANHGYRLLNIPRQS